MFKDKKLIILEDFNFESPKTKFYSDLLANFDQLDSKTLLVLPKSNKNIFLSSRNIKKAKVILASELNTYDVVSTNKMMILESSVKEIEKNL